MDEAMKLNAFSELGDSELEEIEGGWIQVVALGIAGITFVYQAGYALGAAFRPY